MTHADPMTHSSTCELISFEIAGQEFCLDINCVREIRGWAAETPMPQTPGYMRGVINLRGAVMPVIDLRNRLGLGVTTPSSRHVIVVVQEQTRLAGLLVDAVQETFEIPRALLQPPPAMGRYAGHLFVDAIIQIESRLLSRLVVDALLQYDAQMAA